MAYRFTQAALPGLGNAVEQLAQFDGHLAPVASNGPVSFSLEDNQDCVAAEIRFSPGGEFLANCFNRHGGHVVVWDLASRKKICHLHFPSQVYTIAFIGQKGDILVAGCEDGTLNFCEYNKALAVQTVSNPDRRMLGVHGLRVAKDFSFFVCLDRSLTVWEPTTRTGKLIDLGFRTSAKDPTPLDLSNLPDIMRIAVLLSESHFQIVNLKSGKTEVKVKAATQGVLKSIAFSPQGTLLATVEGYGTGAWLRLWRSDNGSELTRVCAFEGLGRVVKFSPDGTHVVACGTDEVGAPGHLRVWDLKTGKNVAAFRCTKSDPACFDISADGKWLATGGWERRIKLYELDRVLKGENGRLRNP